MYKSCYSNYKANNIKHFNVKDILQNSQLPFYVEWISKIHPSNDGVSIAKLSEIIFLKMSPWNTHQLLLAFQ